MTTVLIALGVSAVGAWIYLLLFNGRFWSTRDLLLAEADRAQLAAMQGLCIAAVIPARDEEQTIGHAVGSLLAQRFPGELHIFVVDDNSSDGTAAEAREAFHSSGFAGDCGQRRSVTVLAGRPLEAGWTGKMWAVQQGLERALPLAPDFVLFTDADIEHAPGNVASLVLKAQSGYDMVSLMVRLRCRSWAERLLIPAFVFFFFMLYPPRWTADSRRRTAGAAGGCILIRREALARAGGVAAIRGEIIDDCALARNAKRSGARLWLGLAERTESVRGYGSFAEVGRMIARTAFNQLGHSLLMLVGAVVGLTLVYLLPVELSIAGQGAAARALGALALVLMIACYLPMVRFYRLSPLWAITLPAAALFYMGATVASAMKYWSGRGGSWKGRTQDSVRG